MKCSRNKIRDVFTSILKYFIVPKGMLNMYHYRSSNLSAVCSILEVKYGKLRKDILGIVCHLKITCYSLTRGQVSPYCWDNWACYLYFNLEKLFSHQNWTKVWYQKSGQSHRQLSMLILVIDQIKWFMCFNSQQMSDQSSTKALSFFSKVCSPLLYLISSD